MKSKWVNSFTVALCLTVISGYVYSLDLRLVNLLELRAYDLKIVSRDKRPTSGNVVIVAVDEKSLKDQGRWPWPRTLMAQLVDRLSEAETAVIGFDVLFPEKDVYVPFTTVKEALKEKDLSQIDSESFTQWLEDVSDSDTHFAKSIIGSDRTVLGYFVYPTKESAAGSDAEKLNQTHLNLLDFSQYSIVQKSPTENPIDLRKLYACWIEPAKINGCGKCGWFCYFCP